MSSRQADDCLALMNAMGIKGEIWKQMEEDVQPGPTQDDQEVMDVDQTGEAAFGGMYYQ